MTFKSKFFNFFNSSININTEKEELESQSRKGFLEACLAIKSKREEFGISLQELSSRTKISNFVLQAIENGCESKLPERTFLKQMLLKIESELALSPNTLSNILNHSKSHKKERPIKTFTLATLKIDFFRSWEGNIIYIMLMLISIFLLNKQQIYLTTINSITISPLNIGNEPKVRNDKNQDEKYEEGLRETKTRLRMD